VRGTRSTPISDSERRTGIRVKPEPDTTQVAGYVPDQVFPHPDAGETRSSGVDLLTPDAQRLSGSSVSPLGQPGWRGKAIRWPPSACRNPPGHPVRGNPRLISGIDPMDGRCPSAPSSKGKWGNPLSWRSRKSWTFNRRNSPSGSRGNPDVPNRRVGWTQPLQGKTPVEVGGQPPSPARIEPRSTIRRMDLDHREGRGNPILLM